MLLSCNPLLYVPRILQAGVLMHSCVCAYTRITGRVYVDTCTIVGLLIEKCGLIGDGERTLTLVIRDRLVWF